jgi:hypothetical protein
VLELGILLTVGGHIWVYCRHTGKEHEANFRLVSVRETDKYQAALFDRIQTSLVRNLTSNFM